MCNFIIKRLMNIYQADVICSMVTYISGCASHATASILDPRLRSTCISHLPTISRSIRNVYLILVLDPCFGYFPNISVLSSTKLNIDLLDFALISQSQKN